MKIKINFEATVTDCNPQTFTEIRDRLTFQNPAYLENSKRGFWNGNTPRLIESYKCNDGFLTFPRGFTGQACSIAKKNGEQLLIEDARRVLPFVNYSFNGTMKPFQVFAVDDVLKKDFGTLEAATGAGKTIMALKIIEARSQPALVICHTSELLNQWRERIVTFMGIPRDEIGVVGAGQMRIGNRITVALIQTLAKRTEDVFPFIGHLVVDECHHIPSKTFTDTVSQFDCKYQLGLSATAFRRDGLSKLIFFGIGDVVHTVDKQHLVEEGHICKATVKTIETKFHTNLDCSLKYSQVLSELCMDARRNDLVACHAASEANNNTGITLVLSDRKSHCEALRAVLSTKGVESDILSGNVSKKNRIELTGKLSDGRCKVLIGTSQLLSEGFDCPAIENIVLATPMKWEGRVIQSIGRALRPSPGKDHARIIDFCDINVGVLANGSRSRRLTFQKMPGVTIL